MLTQGPAKKVTIFVNEDSRHHLTALHDAVMTFLLEQGVAGATVTRAHSGFGARQRLHTPQVELLAQHLPMRIEFIEAPEKVEELLPALYEMVGDGLIEVQDTTVVKLARKPAAPEVRAARERREGPARQLCVFLGEADKWHGEPLEAAIVKKLRYLEIAGATVFRGTLGYGAKRHQHKASFFHPVRDLPVMIVVVDSAEKIAAAAVAIEEMLNDGLITVSDVTAIRIQQPAAIS
jgi:PII-like signaling protein